MGFTLFIAIAIFISIHLPVFCVHGHIINKTNGSISIEEDLDRQLEILNKPAVKTIVNAYGDSYDCVDINKQPSFDHPLLKNHKIQTRPSFSAPNHSFDANDLIYPIQFYYDCPEGTVPISRTTKEDLLRARSFFKNYLLQDGTGYIVRIQTKYDANRIYRGVEALISINNPHLYSDVEWSAAVITVRNEDDYIIAGWMVNQELYGDKSTHLFTLWAANENKTGCYNLRCAGFVHTNKTITLDHKFDTDVVYAFSGFSLLQDKLGNWWLRFGTEFQEVGYWPKELFTHLSKGANYMELGGQVYTGVGQMYWPEMGQAGTFNRDYKSTGAMIQILFCNGVDNFTPPDNNFIQVHEERCYVVKDNSFKTGNQTLGYSFLYTGRGGLYTQCI